MYKKNVFIFRENLTEVYSRNLTKIRISLLNRYDECKVGIQCNARAVSKNIPARLLKCVEGEYKYKLILILIINRNISKQDEKCIIIFVLLLHEVDTPIR